MYAYEVKNILKSVEEGKKKQNSIESYCKFVEVKVAVPIVEEKIIIRFNKDSQREQVNKRS